MKLRQSVALLFVLGSAGCSLMVLPAKKTSQTQPMGALWLATDTEADPLVVEHVELAIPWSSAQADVRRSLESLGMRGHATSTTRMRFTQPVDEEALLVVEAKSMAMGERTTIVIRRLLESDASSARAAKVKRAMQQLGRASSAAGAATPAAAPLPPPTPPAASPSTTAPLPPTAPPSGTPVKPLSAPTSMGDAIERPLAPGVTPAPLPVTSPSPRPPHKGRRGSKSAPR